MNARIFFIILSAFSLLSCAPTEEKIEVPPTILSQEKMVEILTYCYMAEGAAGINIKNVPSEKFDSAYLFNPFKDNKLRKSLFDSSIVFYSKYPQTLKVIYENVLDSLSAIQAKGKM